MKLLVMFFAVISNHCSFTSYITRDVNKGFSTVSAAPVNRGAGMGMEAPCVYKLYGSSQYIERITSLILEILPSTSVCDT